MIRLSRMTQSEYDKWRERSIREYIEENVKSGRWSAKEAATLAEKEFQQILPDGRVTNRRTYTCRRSWKMKKILHISEVGITPLRFLMALSPPLASSSGPTVKILGDNSSKINQRVTSTYHFSPGRLNVRPGATATFTNTGRCSVPPDCTHTISIVNESQLPVNVTQVFECLFDFPGTVCAPISDAHFPHGPGGTVVPVANIAGEPSGFQRGNSFVIAHGQTLEIVITATANSTLHLHVCSSSLDAGNYHCRQRPLRIRKLARITKVQD